MKQANLNHAAASSSTMVMISHQIAARGGGAMIPATKARPAHNNGWRAGVRSLTKAFAE